jgi:hypothetical protein
MSSLTANSTCWKQCWVDRNTGITLSLFITLILKLILTNSNYFVEILITTNTSVSQSCWGHRQSQQYFSNVFYYYKNIRKTLFGGVVNHNSIFQMFFTIKTFEKHFLRAPSFEKHFLGAPSIATVFFECFY